MGCTPYDIPAEGTILIEDVGERLHSAVERMIYNLKPGQCAPKTIRPIIGQFTEYKENKSLGKSYMVQLPTSVKRIRLPSLF